MEQIYGKEDAIMSAIIETNFAQKLESAHQIMNLMKKIFHAMNMKMLLLKWLH